MNEIKNIEKIKFVRGRGQAIAEFAIALPVLLAILIGIFEVGRYVFIYAGTANASRNAVRYASAVGMSDGGYTKYKYCQGIKTMAVKTAYLVPVTSVNISYDKGPGTSSFANCTASSGEDSSVVVSSGNRVTVTVTAEYKPIIKLLPLKPRTITSSSSRTILGIIDLK